MDRTLWPWRTTAVAALAIAASNLVLLAGGHLLGADMVVAWSAGEPPVRVAVGSVVLMSIGPALLGGSALWLVGRRGSRAWLGVGWLGLALGLVTVAMPVSVVAPAATTATLAGMHVVAGLVWFTVVRRAAPRQGHPARASGRAPAQPRTAPPQASAPEEPEKEGDR